MAHWRLITILSLAVAVITFAALSVVSCSNNNGASGNGVASAATGKKERVVIGGHTFNLEIAADDASREQGLMNRSSIDKDGGMLFIHRKPERLSYWMKNCLVDIDIIYLDPHGAITAMHRMKAEPPKRADETNDAYDQRMQEHVYPSGYPAQFAIELRSGWLDQLNLKIEDRIPLDLERLKALAR